MDYITCFITVIVSLPVLYTRMNQASKGRTKIFQQWSWTGKFAPFFSFQHGSYTWPSGLVEVLNVKDSLSLGGELKTSTGSTTDSLTNLEQYKYYKISFIIAKITATARKFKTKHLLNGSRGRVTNFRRKRSPIPPLPPSLLKKLYPPRC